MLEGRKRLLHDMLFLQTWYKPICCLRFKDFNSFVLTYDKLGTIEKASIQNIIHEYLNLIKCLYLVFILRNLDYRWLSRKALKTNLLLKSNSTHFSSNVLVIIWYAYLITRLLLQYLKRRPISWSLCTWNYIQFAKYI